MWEHVEDAMGGNGLNLPNLLTVMRIGLIPVYALVFAAGHVRTAFFILLLAGLTDILDGYIARTRGLVTEIGKMLDPLADKLMLLTVAISFLLSDMIPWLAAVALLVRDVGMIAGSALFHFRNKLTVPSANAMGKLTTVLYYSAILCVVFEWPYAVTYLWLVIGFSFMTSALYIFAFRRLNGKRAPF